MWNNIILIMAITVSLSFQLHATVLNHKVINILGKHSTKQSLSLLNVFTPVLCLLLGWETVVCDSIGTKDLRGNLKPEFSWTGPDRNQSRVGEHFKEYFWVGSRNFILGRSGSGYSLPEYETFFPGISGVNLNLNKNMPFIPKHSKYNGYYPWLAHCMML